MTYLLLSIILLASSVSYLSAADQNGDLSAGLSHAVREFMHTRIATIEADLRKEFEPKFKAIEDAKNINGRVHTVELTLQDAQKILSLSVTLPNITDMEVQLKAALGEYVYKKFTKETPHFCTKFAGYTIDASGFVTILDMRLKDYETAQKRKWAKSTILKTFFQNKPEALKYLRDTGDIKE